ncbi:MAG: YfhO family protein, partial [Candidatus Magnetominusculus sp. LBB02]|nr:YfhO family protein [Candidatus Magnetominusculus sp. LBB02]
ASAISAFKAVKGRHWLIFLVCCAICAAPPLITLGQGGQIVRTTIGSGFYYDIGRMTGGNPLIFFGSSMIPETGVTLWRQTLSKIVSRDLQHMEYTYMGTITFAFMLWGFVFSPSKWKNKTLLLFVLFSVVFSLSAYSPLFQLILNVVLPLHTVSHYPELYKCGGFIIVLLGAAIGFEEFIHRPNNWMVVFYLLTGIVSIMLYFNFNPGRIGIHTGIYFILLLINVCIFASIRYQGATKMLIGILLFITFADVSTFVQLHMKNHVQLQKRTYDVDSQNDNKVGLFYPSPNEYAITMMTLKSYTELERKNIDPSHLPEFVMASAYHITDNVTAADMAMLEANSSIPLNRDGITEQEITASRNRLQKMPDDNLDPDAVFISTTYNTKSISINNHTNAAVIFLDDAYHPYWKAYIEGQPVRIFRALDNYKAILVPQGRFHLKLVFSPPFLGVSLLMAVLCLAAITTRVLLLSLRRNAISRNKMDERSSTALAV